jgi:hypothetical protein
MLLIPLLLSLTYLVTQFFPKHLHTRVCTVCSLLKLGVGTLAQDITENAFFHEFVIYFLAKVGGPQISSSNRKTANNFYGLRICFCGLAI